MFRVVAATGIALMLSGCALTQSAETKAPAGLDWYVISQINDFYNDPEDPTNRPPLLTEPPAGVVRAVDVNGDGANDWIVDWPESTRFCGTGGCRVTVYLTHGQNLIRIFDRQVLEGLEFTMVEGEPRFEGRFHHGYCGEDRDECRLAWGLDADQRKLVARPSADGSRFAASSEVTPIDPVWTGEA